MEVGRHGRGSHALAHAHISIGQIGEAYDLFCDRLDGVMKWLLNHEVVRPNKERQGITLPVMIHIKRILYPTDLSPFSVNAVQYALTLSRAHDAELILLHGTESLDGKEELLDSVWDGQ